MPFNTPGISRANIEWRYSVSEHSEDEWHYYVEQKTKNIIRENISNAMNEKSLLLNAGCGTYERKIFGWTEVSLDIFSAPLANKRLPVCGDVCHLPFCDSAFGAVICVGEVLAYADPSLALREVGRVTAPRGTIIIDFGNSKSLRHLFQPTYGRRADLITVPYNDEPENTWVYQPEFIEELLLASGFKIKKMYGTHTWSSLAVRCGMTAKSALKFQSLLEWAVLPWKWSDTVTAVAEKL